MQGIRSVFVSVVLAYALMANGGTAATQAVDAEHQLPSLAPMLEKVLPGVVSIAVRGRMPAEEDPLLSDPFFRRFFGLPDQAQPQEREFQAAGSGVIVDPERGYIITNNHVVEKADEITVIFGDGRHLQAKRIGTDPATDVAVVQARANGLSGLPIGDSARLVVGDYVIALGIDEHAGTLIARVAPRSPADKAGLVPGDVVTAHNGEAIRDSSDLRNKVGLLPIGSRVTMEILHKGGRETVVTTLAAPELEKVTVPRPSGELAGVVLGAIEPGSPLYGWTRGAVVLEVKRNIRAVRAGLRASDVIVAVDQTPAASPEDFVAFAAKHKGGLLLQVVRGEAELFVFVG